MKASLKDFMVDGRKLRLEKIADDLVHISYPDRPTISLMRNGGHNDYYEMAIHHSSGEIEPRTRFDVKFDSRDILKSLIGLIVYDWQDDFDAKCDALCEEGGAFA